MKKLMKKQKNTENLLNENLEILQDFKKLQKTLPSPQLQADLQKIMKKFNLLGKSYATFKSNVFKDLNFSKEKAKSFILSIESSRCEGKQIHRQKSLIKSKENVLKSREREWQRSLGKIRGLWEKNLFEMETSLKYQRETIRRIGSSYFSSIRNIEKELQDALDGPKVPGLKLEQIKSSRTSVKGSSARSSSSFKLSDEDDLISNRSAFSYATEDLVSHRSNSSRARAMVRRVNPPLPPTLPALASGVATGGTCVNAGDINESVEFEKLMNEIEKEKKYKDNPNSISMEKSIGGWKSEYESEESVSFNLNSDEIKKALIVLKKARLLNAGNNQFLLKLAEMIRNPESSSNVELMLQLINLERKKGKIGQRNAGRSKGRGKPPTPTNLAARRRVPSDPNGTSREKFLFSDEKSFNRTILSIENHFSPKDQEFFEGSSINQFSNNDVNLEDLLNVPSYVDSLGLANADNSFVTLDEDKSINKYLNEAPDEFPVRLRVMK
jgi:hypothetical protein